jgi:hypothetical protein
MVLLRWTSTLPFSWMIPEAPTDRVLLPCKTIVP